MDRRKLQVLMSIVDTGSFSKAAEGMEYTQSALSHMVKSMEEELGFELLVRGRGGARLTERGERLMPCVRALLAAYDRFDAEVARIHAHEDVTIRVGAYASMISNWLPPILQRFKREHPSVAVEVRDGSVQDVYRWLLEEHSVDLIFASKQAGVRAGWVTLKNDPLLAILPESYPIGPGEPFPITASNDRQFLMPNLGFHNDIVHTFNQHRVKPNLMPVSIDDAGVIAMVEHGMGVSILSELILEGRHNRVKTAPIEPACIRKLGIATRPGAEEPHVRDFIRCAVEVIGENNKKGQEEHA